MCNRSDVVFQGSLPLAEAHVYHLQNVVGVLWKLSSGEVVIVHFRSSVGLQSVWRGADY